MKENISRLGFKVDLVCEDFFKFTPKKKYDYILLDPPCTSTGTLSKNPDLMFLDPHKRLKNLLKLQENLLQSSTKWISKGGLIIYSVCSLLKEEGEDQILRFLKTNKTFKCYNLGYGLHVIYIFLDCQKMASKFESRESVCDSVC